MKKGADQHKRLVALRRIEGQVRGAQKMVEDGRYCIDILNATGAIIGALKRVEADLLQCHLDKCVRSAFEKASEREKSEKIDEICKLMGGVRK